MIMLSVLRSSGDHKELFQYFEDFDEWSYDQHVTTYFGGDSSSVEFFKQKTEYEIIGGYLKVLRGLGSPGPFSKSESPLFNGIGGNAFCHLIGKIDVTLFAGTFNDRFTFHLIGQEELLINGLEKALTAHLNQTEHVSGTARDLNACLKYFEKAVPLDR